MHVHAYAGFTRLPLFCSASHLLRMAWWSLTFMPLPQVDTTAGLVPGRWIRLFSALPLAGSRRALLAAGDGSPTAAARRLLQGGNVSSSASAPPRMCGPLSDRTPCRPATAAVLSWKREAEALGLDRPEHEPRPGAGSSSGGGVSTASAQGTLDAYIFYENAADSGRCEEREACICVKPGSPLLRIPAADGAGLLPALQLRLRGSAFASHPASRRWAPAGSSCSGLCPTTCGRRGRWGQAGGMPMLGWLRRANTAQA